MTGLHDKHRRRDGLWRATARAHKGRRARRECCKAETAARRSTVDAAGSPKQVLLRAASDVGAFFAAARGSWGSALSPCERTVFRHGASFTAGPYPGRGKARPRGAVQPLVIGRRRAPCPLPSPPPAFPGGLPAHSLCTPSTGLANPPNKRSVAAPVVRRGRPLLPGERCAEGPRRRRRPPPTTHRSSARRRAAGHAASAPRSVSTMAALGRRRSAAGPPRWGAAIDWHATALLQPAAAAFLPAAIREGPHAPPGRALTTARRPAPAMTVLSPPSQQPALRAAGPAALPQILARVVCVFASSLPPLRLAVYAARAPSRSPPPSMALAARPPAKTAKAGSPPGQPDAK